MVCYLTSFKSNIVSVTIFEIFAAKIPDPNPGRFKVIQGSWCQSIVHGRYPIRLLLTQSVYLSTLSQYLTCNFMTMNYASSRSSRIKVHQASRKQPIDGFLYDVFESNIVSLTVFKIFHAKVLWPRSRTVQGHLRSKVMVPIDSLSSYFYSTSIDPIIVSVTIFEIFDV